MTFDIEEIASHSLCHKLKFKENGVAFATKSQTSFNISLRDDKFWLLPSSRLEKLRSHIHEHNDA